MTNKIPLHSENNQIPEYSYSSNYEGENLTESITAKNLNADLENATMSVFQNRSTEGDINEITMVDKDILDQKISLECIEVDTEHNIDISIKINDVSFEGKMNIIESKPKRKKDNPTITYEVEYESQKVVIGSIMILSNGKKIEINEGNINDFNKRKLKFSGLTAFDNKYEEFFNLSGGEIHDYKNQSVEVVKTGGKFSSYILGIISGTILLYCVQNYSKETTTFVSDVSAKVSQSLNDRLLPVHTVKSGENLTKILKSNGVNFLPNQLNNSVLGKGTMLNITVNSNNDLVYVVDALTGKLYTK